MEPSSTATLSLAHLTVLEVPPLDLVSLAAGVGYAAIGLRLYPAFPGSLFYELPAGTAASRQMRARLAEEGVYVHDVEFVGIDADFSARSLAPLLEAAQALGARRLSVCGDDPDRARLTANFASLCEFAQEFGLGVDIEGITWRPLASFADALEVVVSAGMPNGGVLVDALHLARTGGMPRDLRKAEARQVRSVQLCDAPAECPTTRAGLIEEARTGRLVPGHGALPLRELLSELASDASISIEVPRASLTDPEGHARENFQAAQKLIAAARTTVNP